MSYKIILLAIVLLVLTIIKNIVKCSKGEKAGEILGTVWAWGLMVYVGQVDSYSNNMTATIAKHNFSSYLRIE